jgi:hypothetical protein
VGLGVAFGDARRREVDFFELAVLKDVAEPFEGVLCITVPPGLILLYDSKSFFPQASKQLITCYGNRTNAG